jgi:hypothetical protein
MPIDISDTPELVEEPLFGILAIRIPLSEVPSDSWLRHLRLQDLPGKAHTVVDKDLIVHLDRNDQDVLAAMRRIAEAVVKTGVVSEEASEDDEKAEIRRKSEISSKRTKFNGQLQDWWNQEQAKRPSALQAQ